MDTVNFGFCIVLFISLLKELSLMSYSICSSLKKLVLYGVSPKKLHF